MLFSATQTRKVEDLARISLKKEPMYVGVDDKDEIATANRLEQGYVSLAVFWNVVHHEIHSFQCRQWIVQ